MQYNIDGLVFSLTSQHEKTPFCYLLQLNNLESVVIVLLLSILVK